MNKLAIVGSHPETRHLAPFDDLEYDIWVFNEAPMDAWCRRWDAVFQMHKRDVYQSPNNFVNKAHWPWLQLDHGTLKTIWMQERDERIPNSVRYPMEEILQSCHATRLGMLTSTVSMAIALGLYLGYETIELWGVDLGSNTEYAYQQPGFIYWSGVAMATIGEGFALHSGLQRFSNRVYGYEGELQIPASFYGERARDIENDYNLRKGKMAMLRQRLIDDITENRPNDFASNVVKTQYAELEVGELEGALQEARNYYSRSTSGDPISRQQFERRGATGQGEQDKLRTLMDKESGRVEYVFNAWRASQRSDAAQQLRTFAKNLLDLAHNCGGNLGVYHENAVYMAEYDRLIQAAGGQRTLIALGVNDGSN